MCFQAYQNHLKFREEESYSWVCSCFFEIAWSDDPHCYYMHIKTPWFAVLTQLIMASLLTGILIENMRREGFELSVSPPKVMWVFKDWTRLQIFCLIISFYTMWFCLPSATYGCGMLFKYWGNVLMETLYALFHVLMEAWIFKLPRKLKLFGGGLGYVSPTCSL